jgi:murein DD-endopeptidase MepM/ murein hydrolase activator NlpD
MKTPMTRRQTLVTAAALLLCVSALSLRSQTILLTPTPLASGSPTLFTIDLTSDTTSVTARWQEHTLTFFRPPHTSTWSGLAGVDVELKPGTYPIVLEVTRPDGTKQTIRQDIQVDAAPYQEIPLDVPERFVEPPSSALKKIAADQALKNKAFASSASKPLWSGPFHPPLKTAPQTDSFGTRRVFNGKLASIHRGLDYHARTGTPVMAVNSGRIVLARPLYYEGNCIIIDHGLGLMTLYMHLSHFNVKEGQKVRRGQLIALSGGTGRVTGPHLHLGVRWEGAYLDPVKLYAIPLPNLSQPTH